MYIELNRTFRTLSADPNAIVSDDARLIPSATSLEWSDILQFSRVVILSEAGAGKTEEIRHTAQRLRHEGKAAFFLRIEEIPKKFEFAFEEGSYKEFENWLGSADQEGWLLLDSIDEARLRDSSDFERAIRHLSCRLKPALQRVRLILTGRTTAWRPKSDLDLCTEKFPHSASHTNKPAFTVVALDDLSVEQVQQFAQKRGVSDVNALLEEIERTDSWYLTTRPLDLPELLNFWQVNGRIASRLELLKTSIEKRLQEPHQNRDDHRNLAPDQIRKGARLVAATCTLTGQQTIAVPDGAQTAHGLRLDSVLSDWLPVARAALLQRAIFDEEIYGTVRFHHRLMREYLTAEWFAELLKQDVSRKRIEDLFFRKQYGIVVVSPVMRPMLSWLAILDSKIQEQTLRIAPEVLLEDGDPSQLSLATRQKMLNTMCANLAAGVPYPPTDYTAIQRFATKNLTVDVKRLLSTYKDEESQVFLLKMVWQGRLDGALREALELAQSPDAAPYVRRVACRAVHAAGSESDLATLRTTIAQEPGVLNRDLLAELLELSPKSGATFDWFCNCLPKVDNYRKFSVDHLLEAICEFTIHLDSRHLPTAVEKFNLFLDEQPTIESGICDISNHYAWLLRPTTLAINRLIQERDPAALSDAALALLFKLFNAKRHDVSEFAGSKFEVEALIQSWPELKFAFFWFVAEKVRQNLGKEEIDWLDIQIWYSYVTFAPTDFNSVLACISHREFINDKIVALSLAFRLYVECKRPVALRRRLKVVCKDSQPLSDKLQTFFRQSLEFARKNRVSNQPDKARTEKNKKDFEASRQYLKANIDSLRDPRFGADEISNAQIYLYKQMQVNEENWLITRPYTNWQSLESDFGVDVARAFRDSVVAYWRRYRPALVSEGKPSNSTPFQTVFGLAGLAIESRETENWANTLSESEIEVVFRYAMCEINGLPDWFPAVFKRRPIVIRDLLLTEIDCDLHTWVADKDSHYIIEDIRQLDKELQELLSPELLSRLVGTEPKNPRSLECLLDVIRKSTVSNEEIRALAQSKVLAPHGLQHTILWYTIWVGVAPDEAIPALLAYVDNLATDKERDEFVMDFLMQLVVGKRSDVSQVRHAYRTARHLKTLYLLAHRHIRMEDDIDRADGGVYSPGLRDDAQDARERLLSLLRELPGKEAFIALKELAAEHPVQRYRPYLERYAKARAESDATDAPWSEAHVREFNDEYERTPSNHRELFDLAVRRFLDLKADLEHGDSSNAPMLVKAELQETDIRTYIGNWVRDFARGRYSIPQEEELADAKRPDLRFHGFGFDAPVPVELKLADEKHWSGKLFKRLENQLCGGYLRDARSSYGVFLLVYRGKQQSWKLSDKRGSVDFDGLVEALQTHWESIAPRFPDVQEIRVIGVDLTKRKG